VPFFKCLNANGTKCDNGTKCANGTVKHVDCLRAVAQAISCGALVFLSGFLCLDIDYMCSVAVITPLFCR